MQSQLPKFVLLNMIRVGIDYLHCNLILFFIACLMFIADRSID